MSGVPQGCVLSHKIHDDIEEAVTTKISNFADMPLSILFGEYIDLGGKQHLLEDILTNWPKWSENTTGIKIF